MAKSGAYPKEMKSKFSTTMKYHEQPFNMKHYEAIICKTLLFVIRDNFEQKLLLNFSIYNRYSGKITHFQTPGFDLSS